ncbi:YchJ family protein [Alteromonas confluentis]|uniref:YchJ-like middle NTF2-like domain-containing protein n=1 Tax=Alteromonas confluentis TaxID=1656094 RepID=A0A1E7Z5B4_9ALTE|nr:YchJ family metal-binding protein [Alteromonas confluentis]OFC68736.1 hypothetical protein BFC18_01410 [Alteromonas confluentis]
MLCYCNSQREYKQCCGPLLDDGIATPNAEQLMRSRYSAYKVGRFDYILATYSREKRSQLTTQDLQASAANTHWLHLDVCHADIDTVEFKAWFSEGKKLGLMHETSSFVQEDGHWRYHTGEMHNDTGSVKMGRNDPCFCGSGKKHKQCCMTKLR